MWGKFDMLHKCTINVLLSLSYLVLTQSLLEVNRLRLKAFFRWFTYFEFKNSLCHSAVGLFQSLLVEYRKICYYAQSTPITGYNTPEISLHWYQIANKYISVWNTSYLNDRQGKENNKHTMLNSLYKFLLKPCK